jgi:hypothetical protein
LDANQRAGWETYANNWPTDVPTPAGIRRLIPVYKKPQSGINAFQMVNALLASAALARVNDAPLAKTSPRILIPDSVLWDSAGSYIDISWTLPSDWIANDMIRFWIDSQQELFHKQICYLREVEQLSVHLSRVNDGLSGDLLLSSFINSTVFLQMDIVRADGTRSGPTATYEILLTAAP